MKILILGGSGYIATRFVKRLLQKGFAGDIVLVDRSIPKENYHGNRQITIVSIDVIKDSFPENVMSNVQVVFHFMGAAIVRSAAETFETEYLNDVLGTMKILNQMIVNGVRKIVFLSSGGTVYGIARNVPTPETEALKPISTYGFIKTQIESLLRYYESCNLIKPVILRVSSVYGEGYGKIGVQGVIPTILSKALNGETLIILGSGEGIRDFIYIDDVIQILVDVLENHIAGTYNVGTGKGTCVKHLVDMVEQLMGSRVKVLYRNKNIYDVDVSVLECSLIRNVYGWEHKMDVEPGLEKCFQDAVKKIAR